MPILISQKILSSILISLSVKAIVGNFSDGETMVEIQENVRGRDIFIIQSTCAPTNDTLMELIIMADGAAACVGC